MIYDRLSNAALYGSLGPLFDQGFAYLKSFQTSTPMGRYEIGGDGVYAMVQSYATKPAPEKKWESHRRYADIQYVWQGAELIAYSLDGALEQAGDYNADRDVIFYREGDPGSPLLMGPGIFTVFWPHDLHRPGIQIGAPEEVFKVVVKVPLP